MAVVLSILSSSALERELRFLEGIRHLLEAEPKDKNNLHEQGPSMTGTSNGMGPLTTQGPGIERLWPRPQRVFLGPLLQAPRRRPPNSTHNVGPHLAPRMPIPQNVSASVGNIGTCEATHGRGQNAGCSRRKQTLCVCSLPHGTTSGYLLERWRRSFIAAMLPDPVIFAGALVRV